MPDVAMKRILDNTDTKSIFVLQKVCRTLQNFIDDHKPDIRLTELELKATTYGFTFTIMSDSMHRLRVKYLKTAMACPRMREHGVLLEHDYPMPVFLADVGRLLDFQKSKLNEFELVLKYQKYEGEYVEMVHFVGNRLASKSKPLKVLRLWISASRQREITRILSSMEADRITISDAVVDYNRNEEKPLEIDEIVELRQFRNAEKIDASKFMIDDESAVEHFLNISEVSIFVKTLTTEDIMQIKNTFLDPSSAKNQCSSFDVRYKEFEGLEAFMQSMGAPAVSYYGDQWFLRNQDFSRIVCIQHEASSKSFSIFLQNTDDEVLNSVVVQF